jgi:hypothetical protein
MVISEGFPDIQNELEQSIQEEIPQNIFCLPNEANSQPKAR